MSESKNPTKVGSLAVDTSAVVSLFRGQKEALGHFNRAHAILMPVTALGELYCGLRKCNNPEKERLRIGDLRERCLIVGVDEGTAIRYAEIYSDLENKGTMIPINDIWIAAFALRHKMPLLARDDHFSRIDGLDLIAL
ncbi:MAG: type II toxin-antitoxin system VapC family toxin [Opitutaceae bacterium]